VLKTLQVCRKAADYAAWRHSFARNSPTINQDILSKADDASASQTH